ncbi:Transmembrane protein 126A [Lemmus lemmus]
MPHPEEINSFQNQKGICLNTERHTLTALNTVLRGLTANPFPAHLAHDRSSNSFHLTSRRNPILTVNVSLTFQKFTFEYRDLNCESHTVRPGGLFVFVLGGLILILLAIPAHGGLAASCEPSPLPQKGNTLNNWIRVSYCVFPFHFRLCSQHTSERGNINNPQGPQLPHAGLEIH